MLRWAMLRWAMLAALTVPLVSCDDTTSPQWVLRFADADVGAAAVLVRASILEGGCGLPVLLHEVEVEGDGPPERMAPLLGPGRYGFQGEALDGECRVVANGCVEVDLPSGDAIVVTLENGPGTAECPPGTCSRGRCSEAGVVQVAAGRAHTCAADFGDRLYCWGRNETGQVGDGAPGPANDQPSPVLIGEDTNVGALAAGGILTNWRSHSCAVENGSVLCWGYNGQGQIGDATMVDRSRPTPVELDSVSSISAGGRHTCAARDDGGLWCWGDDDFGQLGLGGGDPRPEPTAVSRPTNVVQVCAGQDHTCARTFAGTVFCFGRNDDGQLGDGTTDPRAMSGASVSLPDRAVDIACGEAHSCAALENGNAWCWGNNDQQQCGAEDGVQQTRPVQVPSLDDAVELALGGKVSCARGRSGRVFCWGANAFGQRGTGSFGGTSTMPTLVMGIEDALRIAYGSDHGCAIRATGGLWCWGRNQWGRLGDGTTDDRAAPVQVLGPE